MRKTLITLLTCVLLFSLAFVAAAVPAVVDNSVVPANQEISPGWDGWGEGCTNIMVGKNATVDGSVIATYSCDGALYASIEVVPERSYPPDTVTPLYYRPFPECYADYLESAKQVKRVGEMPQVERTNRYLSIKVWYDDQRVGGMNEYGVTIGETTIPGRKELVNEKGLLGAYMNYPETSLMVLGLERAKTAREAIQVMGSLAEKYGYHAPMGPEHMTVADGNEVWAFEIFGPGPEWYPGSDKPGAVWCAQRIPDGEVGVSANRSRIGQIDLDDPDHFMASPNVFSLAEEMGWYDPKSGKPFIWYEAYGPSNSRGSRLREWRVLSLVAPSLNLDPEADRFPFSVKPDKPLSVQDIMAIHRDVLQGTPYDVTENPAFYVNGKKSSLASPFGPDELYDLLGVKPERTVSCSVSVFSYVAQIRSWLPDPVKGCLWFGFGNAATTCYVPIYSGVARVPSSWSTTDLRKVNRENTYWAFNLVNTLSLIKYQEAIKDIKGVRDPAETNFFAIQPAIESAAVALYNSRDPTAAWDFITNYTNACLSEVSDTYWELVDYLLFKYYFKTWVPEPGPLPMVMPPVLLLMGQ